jgi:hypothetical protein
MTRALLFVGLTLVVAGRVGAAENYIKVEVKGTLQTGVVAIGGETTGILVKTNDGTLELELGKDKDLRAAAEKLNGQPVLVTGTLTLKRGVERGMRAIVTVATLKPAEEKEK